jgi:hypothetical protein
MNVMLYLDNLYVEKGADVASLASLVHPFYRASFHTLSGVNIFPAEDRLDLEANNKLLYPLITKVAASHADDITRFFDVRTKEEYSRPAPEYSLLYQAGLKNVSPLCIKGMGALSFPMALKMADCDIDKKEIALFCLSNLGIRDRVAAGFILAHHGMSDNSVEIVDFRDDFDLNSFKQFIQQNCSHYNYIIEGNTQNWIQCFESLRELLTASGDFHILMVFSYQDCYGYVDLAKGDYNEK